MTKTRNPVAGNAYRYNKRKVFIDRKKEERRTACRGKYDE